MASQVLRDNATVAVFSRGIARAPHLSSLLGAGRVLLDPADARAAEVDYVVGWGHKPTAARARAYADRHGLRYVRLEDGFLRSVELGVEGAPALSMVVDPVGIYYDATTPSRIEQLLSGVDPEAARLADPALRERAEAAMRSIRAHALSKYNAAPRAPRLPAAAGGKRVLVVDQTLGDMSLRLGRAPQPTLQPLLAAAAAEHPDAELLIKTHPDVVAGKRASGLGPLPRDARAHVLADTCNPIELLEQVDHVYVATSQMGFEALMLGKPVTCFGAPFYAGWGLTDDRVATPRRTRIRDLTDVFVAAYLLSCRYVDPQTGCRGELEDVIAHLIRQRTFFARNARRYVCFGFSPWKHPFVRRYLRSPDGAVTFAWSAGHARRLGFDGNATAVVWGQRESASVRRLASACGARLERMEDGFLRSVELGSDLTTPASLVLDGRGLYYDPTRPSDLEHILATRAFGEAERERGRVLREMMVERRISKYAFGSGQRLASSARPGQAVILVVGQVESDASIRLGCRDVRTNLALAEAVRAAHPDAYLLFKAHPDVVSGNRRGRRRLTDLQRVCDEVVTHARIADCLDVASEVHTMTSLVGFEALLRRLPVTTYGQPFYAGWGLTTDRNPLARRQRRLTLDELVVGALVHYPRYVHPIYGEFVEPEAILTHLSAQTASQPRSRMLPWSLRQLIRLKRATLGLLRAL